MRTLVARLPLLGCIFLVAALCKAATPDSAASRPTKRSLMGAWSLVSIQYEGPRGALVDPFYQANSTGIIIYDPSGWMSVHISAPHRSGWDAAASRVPSSSPDPEAERKAAAFDTYYTYYGTWSFDAKSSTMTHHLKSSLIPGESGADYTQQVTLEGGRLVFTNRSTDQGEERVRRKIWQRLSSIAQ
jgi:hypothetical protein